ncbi:MAG: hypothetical protein LBT05_03430 [Planctomycetaceae bacterium]|jgi:cell division protein FtsL|nr:hypothetical protein [Planctomycetaceae bacterium]
MLQELIYTSSPQGLKPGSQGFCTVACTAGMPPNLARFLETLSGYRHVYLPPDPNTVKNPVAFSYLVVRQGGLTWRILSRTADAGLDYTKRTNKISHHLVLDNAELQPSGPAAILLQYPQFCTLWNQTPALLPADKKLPTFSSPMRICHTWRQLTGDAGWGGVLAEAAVAKRPVSLIFHPGIQTAPLIEESLALLPPEQRWNVTFTTYYCNIPTGVDCQWKSLLIGSPEIAQARLSANTLVLDLTQPLSAPPAGKWTELARTGVSPEQRRTAVPSVKTPVNAAAGNDSGEIYGLANSQEPIFQLVSTPVAVSVPGQKKKKSYARGAYDSNRYESEESNDKRGCFWGVVIAFLLLMIALIVGGILFFCYYDAKQKEAKNDVASLNAEIEKKKGEINGLEAKIQDLNKQKNELQKIKDVLAVVIALLEDLKTGLEKEVKGLIAKHEEGKKIKDNMDTIVTPVSEIKFSIGEMSDQEKTYLLFNFKEFQQINFPLYYFYNFNISIEIASNKEHLTCEKTGQRTIAIDDRDTSNVEITYPCELKIGKDKDIVTTFDIAITPKAVFIKNFNEEKWNEIFQRELGILMEKLKAPIASGMPSERTKYKSFEEWVNKEREEDKHIDKLVKNDGVCSQMIIDKGNFDDDTKKIAESIINIVDSYKNFQTTELAFKKFNFAYDYGGLNITVPLLTSK